jgi:hypothetical protein
MDGSRRDDANTGGSAVDRLRVTETTAAELEATRFAPDIRGGHASFVGAGVAGLLLRLDQAARLASGLRTSLLAAVAVALAAAAATGLLMPRPRTAARPCPATEEVAA